jgi:hypothetical protein
MTTQQPSEIRVDGIYITGHTYNVLATPNHMAPGQWNVTATECIGRWPMSRANTGDAYLDCRLAAAVNDIAE